MKKLICFLVSVWGVSAYCQNPTFRSFNTNQFSSNNFIISIKPGALLTNAASIASFVNSVNSSENGSTVTNPVFTWTLAGAPITSQSLNFGIGALPIALRSYTNITTFTTNRTYTLTISDGSNSTNASTSITFYDNAFWGASTDPTPDDPTIRALSHEFATSLARTKDITVNGEYLIVAYPASFGLASFQINGFNDTAWTLETRAFVNSSGASVSYNIYHSNETGLGTFSVRSY